MSALRFISETNVTSAVNNVEIQNCFTDDFDVYKIHVSDMSTDGTTHGTVSLRLMSDSSVLSDSNYDWAYIFFAPNTSSTEERNTNQDKFTNSIATFTDQEPEGNFATFYVYNPTLATSYTFIQGMSGSSYAGIVRFQKYLGTYTNQSSVNGIRLNAEQNLIKGNIAIYGLGDS
jgi:hypothetical protein